jgi:hypothetical protein
MAWTEGEREDVVTLTTLKIALAEALDWPFFENLTWFQAWPGGWTLHGRPAITLGQGDQKSINFELGEEARLPSYALGLALQKVKDNPDRLKQQVRWYCPSHEWEAIVPRGEMHSGCPQCGGYYCEPYEEPKA